VATGSGQVATWTVLFTDMVGSTEFRVRVGEVEFDRVRADLDRRVARAITDHDGVAVKSTGDGVLAGFTATASALRCAAAIQRAVAERNRDAGDVLALRVAISVGDAVVDNGDLQGTAVVEAARLCAIAAPGTILCSDAVRSVSANRSGCAFGEPRSVTLKGLPGPVVVHDVVPEQPADRDPRNGVSFRVLGPLRVERDGAPVAVGGPKEQLVLATLLASAGTGVSVGSIVDTIWGERPPRTAERTVHAYVARLRRALDAEVGSDRRQAVIETVGRGYRVCIEPEWIDAARFERLARVGADLLAGGNPATAATALRDALGEWRGDAYAGLPDIGPCAAEATRLEGLRLGAVQDRVDADLATGEAAALVPELEAAVGEQPFRERGWVQLMLALYRSGRQGDAIEAYQRARRALVDELGIEPGPDLRRMEAAVLAQDPSLDVLVATPVSGPGALPAALREVGPAFVGREADLAWLGEAWADAVDGHGGFVSVLGPEGIGKTRLVAELARTVHADGAAVLYGRCDHAHRGARALLGQALQGIGSSLAHLDGAADETVDLAEAVARHLPTWSRGLPVLFVLDDLQLADAETLEVVADLAGWCTATPMLVIGTFRVEQGQATTPDDTPGGTASQLALDPMSDDAVAQICDLYATEPWSTPDLERICALTGGVPLLVHERASEWARERASRRMTEAGGRLAAARHRLVASRGEVADGVEGIQRLLEQRRAQLAGREAALGASTIAALGGCPYKGLTRFEQADAANFFGRERLVAELIARLAESSFLAIVGPSGSGKSSLVRAGLLPVLTAGMFPGGERWCAAVLCPGRHPGRELDDALRDGPAAGERRVVFVDQFEETFGAGADHEEQDAFIGRLTALADDPDTAVVVAIRADQIGHAAAFPALADRLTGSDILVGPMRDGELRRTVTLPAQRAGLEIEPGLVEVVVSDVAGRAGALPLLSTALAETWERREARTLTLAGYRAAGGVNGALARMAEDAYAALPPGPRAAARRLMVRLCDAGDDGDLSLRRRLPVGEAAPDGDVDARTALEALADRRLLTLDSDAVEVAHEALLREWPRLRTWLEEDVEGRRLRRRLDDAAHSWEDAGRDPSELYRGARLDAAQEWATTHGDDLTHVEAAFLDASRGARDAERRREVVRVRRLRVLLAAVAVALVVSLGAGLVAAGQRNRANDRGRLAEARELAAAANANLDVDPERSVLLALEAVERSRAAPAAAPSPRPRRPCTPPSPDRGRSCASRVSAARSTGARRATRSSPKVPSRAARSTSATRRRASRSAASPVTTPTSTRCCTAPTGSCCSRPATTVRLACGTRRRGTRCTRWMATAWCGDRRSARMVGCSPPPGPRRP
jgi:DNA-binding SARP family transcriptional activator/class 3 adenylate cyclase